RFTRLSARGSENARPDPSLVPVVALRPANGGPSIFAKITSWTDETIRGRIPPTVYRGPAYVHVITQSVPTAGILVNIVGTDRGARWAFDGECTTGFCVDGLCCDRRCSESCEACAATKQDPAHRNDGTCLPMPSGTNLKGRCIAQSPETCGQTG